MKQGAVDARSSTRAPQRKHERRIGDVHHVIMIEIGRAGCFGIAVSPPGNERQEIGHADGTIAIDIAEAELEGAHVHDRRARAAP